MPSVRTDAPASRGPVVWRWHATVVPSGVTSGLGIDVATNVHHERAPGVEAATRRGIDRARDVAGQCDPWARPFHHGVGDRHRGEQRLGVGVLRARVHDLGLALFDDPAEVHHRDAVAHVADDREVVRDEEVRDAELALQRRRIRLITWAWVDTSSELTGSSHTTRPGFDRERTRDRESLAAGHRRTGTDTG